jgi:hypothetical protein
MRKGVTFQMSRGLLLRHDSAAPKATVKKTTGVVLFALPGALELLGILNNTPLVARLYDNICMMFSDHYIVDVRVVDSVIKLISTFTSTLRLNTIEHQHKVSFSCLCFQQH